MSTYRRGLRALMMAALFAGFACVTFAQAAESGKLLEKDGKYVFVESMDPSLKLLLERSVKSGMITQEEYDQVLKESEERSQLLSPSFRAGTTGDSTSR